MELARRSFKQSVGISGALSNRAITNVTCHFLPLQQMSEPIFKTKSIEAGLKKVGPGLRAMELVS